VVSGQRRDGAHDELQGHNVQPEKQNSGNEERGKAASVDFIPGKAVAQQKIGTQVLIRVSECFEFQREYQRDVIFCMMN